MMDMFRSTDDQAGEPRVRSQKTPKRSHRIGEILAAKDKTKICSSNAVPNQLHQLSLLKHKQPNVQQMNSKQIVQLELKPKIKSSKLLSSKSLSQLVPRSLFFRKSHSSSNHANNSNAKQQQILNCNQLTSTRSFPCGAISQHEMEPPPHMIHRVDSISMIGLPRQSTSSNGWSNSSSSVSRQEYNSTLEEPNLSPITGNRMEVDNGPPSFNSADGNHRMATKFPQSDKNDSGQKEPRQQGIEKEGTKKKKTENFKALKSATLALRDVKNSIGMRVKAKQSSQAFVKLTNELATPPIKLYSPFNIYSPDSGKKGTSRKDSKSKRKLNLNENAAGDCSMLDVERPTDDKGTPKCRIALQHKKHLALQADQFSFQSPTGRLRETVKDVEHFQQCIEEISQAIRARDQTRMR